MNLVVLGTLCWKNYPSEKTSNHIPVYKVILNAPSEYQYI